ncbi:hypothetical protein J6590_041342 [Homalodisca vitripennis]|nr:hypothetical protein J6590_041342 [Homalodisca vitripennis]
MTQVFKPLKEEKSWYLELLQNSLFIRRRGETILGPNNTSHGYVVVWLLRPKHSTVQVVIPQIRDKPYNHRQPEIYNSGASDPKP